MKLTPRHATVLIKLAPNEAKTPGGILLPDSVNPKVRRGEVISVGPGTILQDGRLSPIEDLKPGQTVMFGMYSGTEVLGFEADKFVLVRDEEILAIEN